VAIDQGTVVIGAPAEGSFDAGAAHIFQVVSSAIDTDLDGCADKREAGPSLNLGGGRNLNIFWDFFDVPTPPLWTKDRAVTVGDIAAVVARFGSSRPTFFPSKAVALSEAQSPVPAPPVYHAAYDRTVAGSVTGQPNASVTVEDITRVVAQFGHNCL
jgi:hypothetical protein